MSYASIDEAELLLWLKVFGVKTGGNSGASNINVLNNDGQLKTNSINVITKNGAGSYSLPTAPAVNDTMEIIGVNSVWTITQIAGQKIINDENTTSTGTSGNLTANSGYCAARFICLSANSWSLISARGNISIN